jgi:GDP/UDP-N,N'-diacetylbacillosamine 2-epimerase (hydrolysing)
MQGLRDDPSFDLQLVATGMHLSSEYGSTYKIIERDGFLIDRKVEMLLNSDTSVGVSKSLGIGVIGFADAFCELSPDIILVLGDRFEIFSAVSAAVVAGIPVAHLHGGEVTEGAIDDMFRHSITKMSYLHFVATEVYRRRVIQMGEDPERVFNVGGLGVDSINRIDLLSRGELERELNFKFGRKNLLITFHPVTLEANGGESELRELLAALTEAKDTQLIFTLPNADTGGRALCEMINQFVSQHPNARAYKSLGQLKYLSCVAHVDGVVGNSSSGLLEAPSLKVPTINIGDRQRGRLQADSVISCEPHRERIIFALQKLYSSEFRATLTNVRSPYGEGGASEKILQILRDICKVPVYSTRKTFYDLDI